MSEQDSFEQRYLITPQVEAMANIAITGNIIPTHWYQALTFESGKPHFVAVTLLSDIVYWYRPTTVRDEATGQVVGVKKKFNSDFLQRQTKALAAQFGFSEKQVREGLKFLEERGYIKRHFRDIDLGLDNGVLSNRQFIELIPSAIEKLQKGHTYSPPGLYPPPSRSIPPDPQGLYTNTSPKTSPQKDTVLTVPPSKMEVQKKSSDEEGKRPTALTKRPTEKFASSLKPDQRKIHDRITKYRPQWGKPPESQDVCAWFLAKKYTCKQIDDALIVYEQDVADALDKGRTVDNMGGAMVAILKSGRTPKNLSFEANKALAIASAKNTPGMEAMDKYVTFRMGHDEEKITYDLPMHSFTGALKEYKNRILYADL